VKLIGAAERIVRGAWLHSSVIVVQSAARLRAVLEDVYGALGLDWDPACLEFHLTSRPVRTASRTQVRRPLHGRSVARWRRYEHELADLFAALPAEAGPRHR